MDFSNIFNMINELIPSEIAGIDSLYIGVGTVLLILLLWIVLRNRKKTPKRELPDLSPEEVSEDAFLEPGTSIEGTPEEAQEVHAGEESEKKKEERVPEEGLSVEAETPEEEPAVEEEAVVEKTAADVTAAVVRKKRESTREGKKRVKADFADFSGRRLLIAEDNMINQKVINGVLNESGIDVVMADDGQFVMEILEKDSDFEIILMDAHMPRMDGFEATRLIRENPAYDHIAVVALSGDTAADDIRHMSEAGMEEHLEKPLKMDALYDVMSMYYTLEEAEDTASVSRSEVEELEIAVDADDLACLDYDLGLEICGNDEAMYRGVLKEFFLGYKDSSKKLREALIAKNYSGAQEILIDVKGTASNLGAKQLVYITERFLEALAEEKSSAYAALFKDYQSYLLALLKSIQNAFKI